MEMKLGSGKPLAGIRKAPAVGGTLDQPGHVIFPHLHMNKVQLSSASSFEQVKQPEQTCYACEKLKLE